jgi:hypothetical protein
MNKKVIIGLGILAVAGIGYYMWKNKKSTKSRISSNSTPPSEMGATQEAEYNVTGGTKTTVGNRCPKGWVYANGKCNKLGATYVAGWENGQEPTSNYVAGWDKDKATPMPCNQGYTATLDPIKGTICTPNKKNMVRPYISTVNS